MVWLYSVVLMSNMVGVKNKWNDTVECGEIVSTNEQWFRRGFLGWELTLDSQYKEGEWRQDACACCWQNNGNEKITRK